MKIITCEQVSNGHPDKICDQIADPLCAECMDGCIEFYVVNADSEDNESRYFIDLTAEEQSVIYARLDEQCKIYLGKSCEELLAEAGKELEEESS